MKIVVTGAAGFIGSHLAEALVHAGHSVVGIDIFDDLVYPQSEKREHINELLAGAGTGALELVEANISDVAAMNAAIDSSVDLVCHLAALPGVRPSLAAPERYIRNNVEGTIIIAETCLRAGIRKLLFTSSSSVYGAREQHVGFAELAPCLQQVSPYAASKRCAELVLSTYRNLYGLGVTVIRPFTVYGPRQRSDMGIHRFLRAVAEGRPISIYGDGDSRRDYTYVSDIVEGIMGALAHLEPEAFEVFNLGSSHDTGLTELISLVEEVVGRKAITEQYPTQPGDVPFTLADTSRARSAFGFRPKIALREGLERQYQHYRHIR